MTFSTIEAEAGAIGTLRASGYTKGEIIRHYMAAPTYVFLAAAVIGNIGGYTCFRKFMEDMYYHSYSLPVFKVVWKNRISSFDLSENIKFRSFCMFRQ